MMESSVDIQCVQSTVASFDVNNGTVDEREAIINDDNDEGDIADDDEGEIDEDEDEEGEIDEDDGNDGNDGNNGNNGNDGNDGNNGFESLPPVSENQQPDLFSMLPVDVLQILFSREELMFNGKGVKYIPRLNCWLQRSTFFQLRLVCKKFEYVSRRCWLQWRQLLNLLGPRKITEFSAHRTDVLFAKPCNISKKTGKCNIATHYDREELSAVFRLDQPLFPYREALMFFGRRKINNLRTSIKTAKKNICQYELDYAATLKTQYHEYCSSKQRKAAAELQKKHREKIADLITTENRRLGRFTRQLAKHVMQFEKFKAANPKPCRALEPKTKKAKK